MSFYFTTQTVTAEEMHQQNSAAAECNYNNQHEINISPTSHRRIVRQRTVTVLPEEDPLLSPASELRVTRKVGQDGLVIAWLPSPDSECAGYLVIFGFPFFIYFKYLMIDDN